MSNKVAIKVYILILVALFITFIDVFFPGPFSSVDDILTYINESGDVTTYFENEKNLRVGQEEEYRIFRIPKEGFLELCSRMEPEGWRSEELFTAKTTGKVWLLYPKSFPPFTVDWLKDHEEDVAREADRLVWIYRWKRLLRVPVVLFVLLIIYGVLSYCYRRKLKTGKEQKNGK